MNMKKLFLAAALLLATAASAQTVQTVQINGAGATFPSPIYTNWFDQYHKAHPNAEINYQPIGSGGGIRQLSAGTVFFGASDGPMTNDQILAAGFRILHLPTVLGGVVPIYNIPEVKAELRFPGKVLAGIYLGKQVRQ
jgi:phosphate transport system substrate-binding protein